MAIEDQEGPEWPGARTRLVPPITEAVCNLYPSFNELVRIEGLPGRGCTVRRGVGFAARPAGQIQNSCDATAPEVSAIDPGFLTVGDPVDIYGTPFLHPGGSVWLGDKSSWVACDTQTEQPIAEWTGTRIRISSVTWAGAEEEVFIFVVNRFGNRSAPGFGAALFPNAAEDPAIGSLNPALPTKGLGCTVWGENFYTDETEVHIGDAATWAGCVVTTLQPVGVWTEVQIRVTNMTWGGPAPNAWVYVLNMYGKRNANGFEFLWAP